MDPDRIATVITAEASLPLWDRAADIWIAGGWAMVALAIVAFAIFGVAIGVCIVGARKWMRARLEMHRELQRRGGYSHVSQDDEAPSPGARHAGQVELGPRG